MSNKQDLLSVISECYSDLFFSFNGKSAGVTSTVSNYVPLFQVWYGQDTKEYSNIDDLMADPFFDGKTLVELEDVVDFTCI